MLVNGNTALKAQVNELNYYSTKPSSTTDDKTDVFGTPNLPENKHSVPGKLAANAVEKANKVLMNSDRRLEYKIHEATKQVMVKVINKDTGEVVREIPSEKILDMVASMCKTAGILVDEKR